MACSSVFLFLWYLKEAFQRPSFVVKQKTQHRLLHFENFTPLSDYFTKADRSLRSDRACFYCSFSLHLSGDRYRSCNFANCFTLVDLFPFKVHYAWVQGHTPQLAQPFNVHYGQTAGHWFWLISALRSCYTIEDPNICSVSEVFVLVDSY